MTDVNINNIVPDSNLLDYFPQLLAVEPQYNEGPRDGQNLYAIRRGFVISRLIFIYFTITGVRKNRSLFRGLPYIEVRYI